jgi:ribonuclease VapC
MSAVMHVLDASAVLAVVHRERGWRDVVRLLDGASISAVNWCEVAERSVARGVDLRRLRAYIRGLPVMVVPFDEDTAEMAALLKPATRMAGLSLADRACLALAMLRDAPAVTTDRAWTRIDVEVEVHLVR